MSQVRERIEHVAKAIATVTDGNDPARYADIVAIVLFLDESAHGDGGVIFDQDFQAAYGNALIRLREKLRKAA